MTICCAAEKQLVGWDDYWNKIDWNGDDRVKTEWGCEGGGTYLGFVYRIDIINGERVATILEYRGTESKLMISSDIEGTKVVGIGNSAFSRCSSLTSVVIPEGVTSIGDRAFSGCSSLTSVVIPGSVTSIDEYAFAACTSLTSVVIPEGVTSIGENAFRGCSSLTIYCEAKKKPEGWNDDWNPSDRPVVWGYKSKP